jgi:F-type H+-transporting ATPase subunit b
MSPPNLSLIFIMVCFWVAMWLVYRFLIQPVGAVLAERKGRIDGAAEAWEDTNQQYLDATARLERETEDAAREAARVRAEYRQQALDRRQKALEEARAVADGRLEAALDELESATADARQELRDTARGLAGAFASRLLERKVTS